MGAVLDFVDSGHDLILAADASASDLMRSIATELGVDFDEVCELPDGVYHMFVSCIIFKILRTLIFGF